jgi:photosystem II stability/assembly factor-like uncharacterized protein
MSGHKVHAQQTSQWQQNPVALATPAKSDTDTGYRYLMLDTGGSGGMFGKGDIHSNLQSTDFWDEHTGWAAGEGGVFKTEDGGVSWTRIMQPALSPARWWRVALREKNDVWLLKQYHGQANGELYRSRDGGKNWHEVLKGKLHGAADLQARGPVMRVLCGDFRSYRSIDGGDTWIDENFGGLLHGTVAISAPGDMRFPSGYRHFVLGHYQRKVRLIASDDNGRTWSVLRLPEPLPPSYWQFKLFFATTFAGAISLVDGRVLLTRDGGKSWKSRMLAKEKPITALWFDDFGTGFAAIENSNAVSPGTALLKTDDGGATWHPIYRGRVQFNAITGQNSGHLWAVGKGGSDIPSDAVMLIFKTNAARKTVSGGQH